jgi:hypothetical protein
MLPQLVSLLTVLVVPVPTELMAATVKAMAVVVL